jgi:nickel/cobalt transporter (NicO) family protein
MKTKSFLLPFLACLLVFTGITTVHAHPADIYAHTISVTISQSDLRIKWEIKPGPMLTSFLWHQADADQDGNLSQQEVNEWGNGRAALLTATLDEMPLPLLVESINMPADLKSFQAGVEFITINLSAKWPRGSANTERLVFDNGMEQKTSINWFYLFTTEDSAFLLPSQKNHTIGMDIIHDRALLSDPGKLLTKWDSGTPSLPAGQQKDIVTQTSEQVVPALAKRTPQDILLDLVRTENFSISFYIFALGISLALGALHALTPGHGKTVVAAYLVGSRGTAWHAIVLGSVVTLTHTGSVFLLGMITLTASQYILPTRLIPWLEIASGLMIVSLGLYLWTQRFLAWRNTSTLAQYAQGSRKRKYVAASSPLPLKRISGPIKIQKLPENLHQHAGGKMHSHEMPETITWRSLITLGISGGLVPCPDAIAILLVAIALNRILLGLALIVSFSIGLAVILIGIGLLMVGGSRLFKRFDFLNRFAALMPVVSASIVLLLGVTLTYGAFTRLGDGSVTSPAGEQSAVNEAQIIYLNDDDNRHKQLFLIDTKGSDPRQLTHSAKGVIDFAVSADQARVIYVEQTEELDYALWIADPAANKNKLMIQCEEVICSQPIWSPDGKHIVYEYSPLDTGTSSLWWFDVATGQTQPVFQEARLPGTNPRWSPDGKWLSYATPDGIRLNQLENGQSRLIPNLLGAAVQWSPDSSSILLRDVVIKHDQYVTQLFLYNLSSGTLINLNPNENMESVLAAWSPDGAAVAVVRRDLSIPRGDQIWIMRADGSQARSLTDIPAVLHGSLNWSPDGQYILYDLYLLDSFPLQSRLEMINIDTREITNLKRIGYDPKWILR